jgi:uncharacterized protein YndB with AHSA1/START domain
MTQGWTHEYSFPIPADPARIFAALTKQTELEQWFAEHAHVEAREGGAFRFWGRYTVGTPAEADAAGTVLAIEPDARLVFEWPLFGVATRVTITLAPQEVGSEGGTKVTVHHALDGPIDQPRPKELVDDWWRFVLGNLGAHTSGQGEVMRPDFSDPSPEIRLSMTVAASPEKVFRALIEPEALNRWLAKDAKVEPRVGGKFDLGWKESDLEHEGAAMEIVAIVPNEKLEITWPDWRGDTSVPTQSVTWLLEPDGDGTRVTLVHAGFIRTVDLGDYPFGWGYFLSQMAEVAVSLSD